MCRSETQLLERIDTDLLFRWFLDMDPAEDAFDATAFTHNRPRLEKHGLVAAFFDGVVRRAMAVGLTSDEHFSVDGTLIESHASIKSFKAKDGSDDRSNDDQNGFKPRNAEVNFHGQKRSNATHASRTDPESRLFRKGNGQPAKLYHTGHAIAENRHGLVMSVLVEQQLKVYDSNFNSSSAMWESFFRAFTGDFTGKINEAFAANAEIQRNYGIAAERVRTTFEVVEKIAVEHGATLPKK